MLGRRRRRRLCVCRLSGFEFQTHSRSLCMCMCWTINLHCRRGWWQKARTRGRWLAFSSRVIFFFSLPPPPLFFQVFLIPCVCGIREKKKQQQQLYTTVIFPEQLLFVSNNFCAVVVVVVCECNFYSLSSSFWNWRFTAQPAVTRIVTESVCDCVCFSHSLFHFICESVRQWSNDVASSQARQQRFERREDDLLSQFIRYSPPPKRLIAFLLFISFKSS